MCVCATNNIIPIRSITMLFITNIYCPYKLFWLSISADNVVVAEAKVKPTKYHHLSAGPRTNHLDALYCAIAIPKSQLFAERLHSTCRARNYFNHFGFCYDAGEDRESERGLDSGNY